MVEGVGSGGSEDGAVFLLTGPVGDSEDGESDLGVLELVRAGSSDLGFSVEDCSLDDGDGVGGSTMIAGHLCVELTDGSVEGDVTVLLVHVVVSGPGLVPEDNTESFDVVGSALEDLIDSEDLSLGALGLELTPEMVPEFRFGDDFVLGEEADSVYFGAGVLLSRQFASHHKVLSDLILFT